MKLFKAALLVICASSFSALTLGNQTYFNKGLEAYQAKNYKIAHRYWKRAAKENNLGAIYNLGLMYSQGIYVDKNLEKAQSYLTRVAIAGLSTGQYTLAKTYLEQEKFKEALKWFEAAAESKDQHAQAQYETASLYEKGLGTDKSLEKTEYWLKQAAGNGSEIAQLKLVLFYVQGDESQKNPTEGFKWARIAAENGNPTGKYLIGYLYHHGIGTEKDDALAVQWLEDAIGDGHPQAQALLATIREQTVASQ